MATSKTLAPTNVTISIPAMTDAPNASVLANCADKEADAINALNSQIANLKGLSEAKASVTATDLNDCQYAGAYMFNNSCSNKPSGANYGVCFTIATSQPDNNGIGWVCQIAFGTADATKLYMRTRINNGTWSEWKSITFA